MTNDPLRILREYALEPLRHQLRIPGSRVLFVDERSVAETWGGATLFDAAFVELHSPPAFDPRPLAGKVAGVLRPGARVVCVIPSAASLGALWRAALLGDGAPGRGVFGAWRAAFEPHVEWRRARGFGILLPASSSWPQASPLLLSVLGALEHVVNEWPGARALGAWAVHEGVRR